MFSLLSQLLVIHWNIVSLWPFPLHHLFWLIRGTLAPLLCPTFYRVLRGIFLRKCILKMAFIPILIPLLVLIIIGRDPTTVSLFLSYLPLPCQSLPFLFSSLFIAVAMRQALILDLVRLFSVFAVLEVRILPLH